MGDILSKKPLEEPDIPDAIQAADNIKKAILSDQKSCGLTLLYQFEYLHHFHPKASEFHIRHNCENVDNYQEFFASKGYTVKPTVEQHLPTLVVTIPGVKGECAVYLPEYDL